MMRVLDEDHICEVEGCSRPAEELAYSRRLREVMAVCHLCGFNVADEDSPEYIHTCENCGCSLPIN